MSFVLTRYWMVRRTLAMAIVLATAAWIPANAQMAPATLRFMDGTWRSGEFVLLLDMERMLANFDPVLPFQRDDLIIRNMTGNMVHFSFGRRWFLGHFYGDELALTGDGLSGTVHFHRLSQSGAGKAGPRR